MLTDENEDYTKLKAIVKENVKAVLSENRKIISISFVALIQTIKTDPQMVKLIQNISRPNGGEQHKDNHTIINQYFECNKDSILCLTEKHYQNLVEAFTKNVMNNAAASPSSLSSAFSSSFTQSDTNRIEEQEGFHFTKGDMALLT